MNLWNMDSMTVEAETSAAVTAARDAAAGTPGDPALASALLKALGREYALRGLDDWAVTVLEQARAGGAVVSPLLLGRSYWRLGRLQLAHTELEKALDQKEAPPDYLGTCLKRLDVQLHAANATTGPASK